MKITEEILTELNFEIELDSKLGKTYKRTFESGIYIRIWHHFKYDSWFLEIHQISEVDDSICITHWDASKEKLEYLIKSLEV